MTVARRMCLSSLALGRERERTARRALPCSRSTTLAGSPVACRVESGLGSRYRTRALEMALRNEGNDALLGVERESRSVAPYIHLRLHGNGGW